MVYVNTLMIQGVLADPSWTARLKKEDIRVVTPLIHGHVNPYGIFRLDMNACIPLNNLERSSRLV